MNVRADEVLYLLATVVVLAVTVACSAYMVIGSAKLAAALLSGR